MSLLAPSTRPPWPSRPLSVQCGVLSAKAWIDALRHDLGRRVLIGSMEKPSFIRRHRPPGQHCALLWSKASRSASTPLTTLRRRMPTGSIEPRQFLSRPSGRSSICWSPQYRRYGRPSRRAERGRYVREGRPSGSPVSPGPRSEVEESGGTTSLGKREISTLILKRIPFLPHFHLLLLVTPILHQIVVLKQSETHFWI